MALDPMHIFQFSVFSTSRCVLCCGLVGLTDGKGTLDVSGPVSERHFEVPRDNTTVRNSEFYVQCSEKVSGSQRQ